MISLSSLILGNDGNYFLELSLKFQKCYIFKKIGKKRGKKEGKKKKLSTLIKSVNNVEILWKKVNVK